MSRLPKQRLVDLLCESRRTQPAASQRRRRHCGAKASPLQKVLLSLKEKPLSRAHGQTQTQRLLDLIEEVEVTDNPLELTRDAVRLAAGIDSELLEYVDGKRDAREIVSAWGADAKARGHMWLRHREALARRVASFVDRGIAVSLMREE